MPAEQPPAPDGLRALLRAARTVLDAQHATPLTLATLARQLATSSRQLERAFASAGQTTFRAELTAARLRRAEALLDDPDATIAEVAEAVGYRQAAHFAKAFRVAYGAPPSEWLPTGLRLWASQPIGQPQFQPRAAWPRGAPPHPRGVPSSPGEAESSSGPPDPDD